MLDGDLNKWRKLINTFKLRVLINLSKRVDEADLKVKEQFAAILSDPARVPHHGKQQTTTAWFSTAISRRNRYPLGPYNRGFGTVAATTWAPLYLDSLTAYKTPVL